MDNKFEFADFSMTSQDFDHSSNALAVVNPSSDNGRSFWTSTDEGSSK